MSELEQLREENARLKEELRKVRAKRLTLLFELRRMQDRLDRNWRDKRNEPK